MTKDDPIKHLVRSLRQDVMPCLSDQQLEITLAWLAGSQSGTDIQQMNVGLGPAGEDQDLTLHVFAQVDALLFREDRLCLNAAGLTATISAPLARRRFRLLLSAFHPDRMQWHADWLTPRFQAINLAYREFKLNPAPDSTRLQTTSADSKANRQPATRYQGISPGPPRPTPQPPSRQRRWRQDRWLGHKIVAVLSLLVVLPLLSWSLDSGWLSTLFQRHQSAEDESTILADDSASSEGPKLVEYLRTTRGQEDPPSVAALLDQWNLILAAEIEQAPKTESAEPQAETPPHAVQPRSPAVAEAESSLAISSEKEMTGQCVPTEPAMQFGTWLSEGPNWSLADVPIGARPSRLRAGAIDGHALADAMENYRRSVEAGNLGQLLRSYVEMPRANTRQGERWLQETYGALFEVTDRRSLSLNVVEAYRHDEGWNVVIRYLLGARLSGCAADHVFERELRFYLVQDPLLFRIAAVDY